VAIRVPFSREYGGLASSKKQQKAIVVEINQFNRGLTQFAADFGENAARQFKKMMSDIENRAKRRAPVRTGTMRAGVWWRVERAPGGMVYGVIGSHASYGKYTEFVDKPGGRIQMAAARNSGAYAGRGTVADPFTMWPARLRRGANRAGSIGEQSMPWLRPAIADVFLKTIHVRLKWAFRDALRRRGRGKR